MAYLKDGIPTLQGERPAVARNEGKCSGSIGGENRRILFVRERRECPRLPGQDLAQFEDYHLGSFVLVMPLSPLLKLILLNI
jgi:hypothetical protein